MERNVPKLRFKGFNDEWKKEVISSICKLSSGSTPSKARKEYFNGTHLWVTSGELKNKYIYNTIDKITDKAIKNTNLKEYEIGSFIIAIYGLEAQGTRGSSAILGRKATISQACMAIEPVKDIYSEFLYYWYAKYGDMIGIRYAQGTKQQNLSTDLVGNLKIIFPSLKEQERITNFLTKVDKIIEKQDEKVKNLENYKKGMMQKIFSQEIRFKDENGEDYPEWGEKFISEIATLISSKRVYLSDYVSEGIPFYRGKEITELKNNKIPSDILFISNQKYNEMKNKYGVPKKGDLLLTAVGTLGNSWVIEDNNPFYFKDGNLIWFKELKINVKYLDFYINSNLGKKKIIDSAIGSTQKALTIINLNKIKINVPCMDEQKKIVNYLNKVDNINKKENEKLEKLKQLKKGLLQQMFI